MKIPQPKPHNRRAGGASRGYNIPTLKALAAFEGRVRDSFSRSRFPAVREIGATLREIAARGLTLIPEIKAAPKETDVQGEYRRRAWRLEQKREAIRQAGETPCNCDPPDIAPCTECGAGT